LDNGHSDKTIKNHLPPIYLYLHHNSTVNCENRNISLLNIVKAHTNVNKNSCARIFAEFWGEMKMGDNSILDTGYLILHTRCWMFDTRCCIPDDGCFILDTRC